jgi:hypothetical protein
MTCINLQYLDRTAYSNVVQWLADQEIECHEMTSGITYLNDDLYVVSENNEFYFTNDDDAMLFKLRFAQYL